MDQAAPRQPFAEELLRSVESLRFGPFWLALALAAAIFALFVLWCAAFGLLDEVFDATLQLGPARQARTTFVLSFLLAFLIVTPRYEARKAPDDWASLQPATNLSRAEFARVLVEGRDRASKPPLVWQLGGAAIGVGVVILSIGSPSWILQRESWGPLLVWSLLMNVVVFVIMARAAYASLLGREQNDEIARRIARVDLLDTGALRGFARHGLRRAFYWAGGSSIASLLGLELAHTWPLVAILALTLALASFALLDPMRVVRRRIRETKRTELARVRERIHAVRHELLAGPGRAPAAAELPGLLAYEARIQAVSEWPFDTPTRLRFAALALLATGSWLGGALVERLLDVALD